MKLALSLCRHFAIIFTLSFIALVVKAATISSTLTGGNWSSTSTWVSGVVPGSGDAVTIVVGSTVTVDITTATCASLTLTPASNGTSTLAFSPNCILAIVGNITIGSNGQRKGSLIMASSSTLKIGGTLTVGNNFAFTASTGTIEFNSATAQTVGTDLPYYNLTFSGGAKTTASGTLTVNGTWAVGVTTALNTNNTTVSLTGDLTGTGSITQGTGLITVGGSWLNTGNFTASTKGVTLTGTGAQITGAAGLTFTTLTVSGTYTNNNPGTLTVSTALSGTGGLTEPTNATLKIGGSSGITTLTATSTGNTVNYTGAGQTIKGTNYYHLTLNGSGTDVLQTGTTSILGNFTLGGTVTTTAVAGLTIGGNIIIGGTSFNAGSFTHNVGGNWQYNAGTFSQSTSTINFNGSSPQTIGGTIATTFANLTINNSNGVSLNDGTNSVNKTVNGVLTLTAGLLTTTSSNLLILANGGSISATVPDPVGNPNYYTATSYINGPLQAVIGTSSFTFPIGKSGTGYAPISVSGLFGSSPTPQTFTAEYIHTSAMTLGPIDVGSPQLVHVSGCDYWRLDLGSAYPATTNSALPNGITTTLTLYWNPNNGAGCSSTYVSSTSSLVIAHLNFKTGQIYAGQWTAIGGSYSYTGSTTNGSISYAGASTFSPFALGTTNGAQNPLDIKLDYFTAAKAGAYNKLSWKAECTSSSNLFEAQRSSDGISFTTIDTVKVGAASDCSKGFVYDDYSIADNKIYYRIKTTDVSGNVGYSDIKLISNQPSAFEFIGINPNPVKSNATLSITSAQNEKIELTILSIDGRELQHKTLQLQNGTNIINLQTSDLPKGMYFIKGIFSSGQTNTIKFMKE